MPAPDDSDSSTQPVVMPLADVQNAVDTVPQAISGEIVKQSCAPAPVSHQESDAVKIARINAQAEIAKRKWTVLGVFGFFAVWLGFDWWSKRDLNFDAKTKEGSSLSFSLTTPPKHKQNSSGESES